MDRADAEYLLNRPEFLRFLYAAIQSAGILGHTSGANGQSGRDLSFFEGRRSLGFELLTMADAGQPEPLRSGEALATIDAVIRLAINPASPKEPTSDRRNDTDRYRDIGSDGDGATK